MAQDDSSQFDYNSMQRSLGLMPPTVSAPAVMSAAQVSAMIAQQGASQIAQMSAVTQIARPAMGPFGSPMFPQMQPTFVGSPGMMPGPNGIMMPMSAAGPSSPYSGNMGSSMGMASPMTPPGNLYAPSSPAYSPPMYHGAMGQMGAFPMAPMPPAPMFDSAYSSRFSQGEATRDRIGMGPITGLGMGARLGMDAGMGVIGARIGGQLAGPGMGRILGGAAGFLGAEMSGMGGWAQNGMMDNVMSSAGNMRAYGSGIESLSRRFVSDGPDLSGAGVGFSRRASINSGRQLMDLAGSSSFQSETFNKFNTADVMKIAQSSGEEGLLNGIQSPHDMKQKVREVSRAVSSFMELANEPDLIRAIQVMGQMRTSGLSLGETLQAVSNGRTFARMAGTSFESLSNGGGAYGAGTFQSMGLSQGLGQMTGMMNQGIASAGMNSRTFSPQLMNLMGGASGLANMNNMFSAGMLQMPMMAPAMMGASGGINANAMRQMMAGNLSPQQMAAMGSNNMGRMGERMGTGGLGMSLAMQPMLQDAIGRMMQSQGPFAQRNTEDRQVFALMREMGLHGSEGFTTAGQMMGMSGTQAISRAQEMGDPRYFARQRRQIEQQRRERRTDELRAREAMEPDFLDEMSMRSTTVDAMTSFGRRISRGVGDTMGQLAGGGPSAMYNSDSRSDSRRLRQMAGSSRVWDSLRTGGHTSQEGFFDRMDRYDALSQLHGGRGIAATLGAGVMALDPRIHLDSESRQYAQTGNFLGGVMNSSRQERHAAMGGVGEAFGDERNLRNFSSNIASMYGNQGRMGGGIGGTANLLFRGGANMLSNGLVDPGNIAGGEAISVGSIRRRYVEQMRGRGGMSDGERGTYFDQHQSTISAQMGQYMESYATSDEAANMRRQLTALSGVRRSGRGVNSEAGEVEAYAPILGGGAESRNNRRRVDELFKYQGFGNTEQQRSQSANYMAARTALRLQAETADPQRRAAIRRQLAQLDDTAQRQGVNIEEGMARTDSRVSTLRQDRQNVSTAQQLQLGSTGASAMEAFNNLHEKVLENTNRRRMTGGIDMLSRQSGVLGAAFQGVLGEDGNINADHLRSSISSIGSDDTKMRQLEASNPELARMFRSYTNGNAQQRERAFGQIGQFVGAQGERVDDARRAYQSQGAMSRGWQRAREGGLSSLIPGVGLYRALAGAAQDENSYVQDRIAGGTRADAEAIRQTGQASSMQGQAEGQGMGAVGDRLLQASTALLEASRNLNHSTQDQSMEDLFGTNPGNQD